MTEMMKERKPTGFSGFWRGFLGHVAYYVGFPHTLASWLHKVRGVKIQRPRRVRIAANVLIDSLYPELVTIEDDVIVTRGTTIVAHFEPTPFLRGIIGDTKFGTVHIKRGVYIGVSSIILPGVTIGEGAIIGAGSVVTKDIPDYAVAVGNPARVIRDLRDGFEGPPERDTGE